MAMAQSPTAPKLFNSFKRVSCILAPKSMYDRSGKQEEKLGGEKERRRREEGGKKEGRRRGELQKQRTRRSV